VEEDEEGCDASRVATGADTRGPGDLVTPDPHQYYRCGPWVQEVQKIFEFHEFAQRLYSW